MALCSVLGAHIHYTNCVAASCCPDNSLTCVRCCQEHHLESTGGCCQLCCIYERFKTNSSQTHVPTGRQLRPVCSRLVHSRHTLRGLYKPPQVLPLHSSTGWTLDGVAQLRVFQRQFSALDSQPYLASHVLVDMNPKVSDVSMRHCHCCLVALLHGTPAERLGSCSRMCRLTELDVYWLDSRGVVRSTGYGSWAGLAAQ